MHPLEQLEVWSPIVVGLTHAGFAMYYANDFPGEDVSMGEWNGDTGHAMLALSGASIAIQTMAIIAWARWFAKMKSGKISMKNKKGDYQAGMGRFWMLMLLFYVLALALSSITVVVVSDFDGQDVAVVDDKLKGDVGKHVLPLAASVAGVGAVAALYYGWVEYKVKDPKTTYTMLEVHD